MTLPFHAFANVFPLIMDQEFSDLVDDIRANGLRDPIVLLDGDVLDGRNRYRALTALVETGECLGDGWGHRAGQNLDADMLEPGSDNILFRSFQPEADGDALAYVISKNLKRRQLTVSQRAFAVAELETLSHGGARRGADQEANLRLETRERLAASAQVSERSVNSAAVVRDHAVPELQQAVRAGAVTVSAAADVAALPQERQAEIVSLLPRDASGRLTAEARKALAPVIKEVRAEKQAEKKARREDREAELGRKLQAMPEKKYGIAIEDFEWDHEPWSRDSGMDRHPSNHYPTASDAHTPEEIVARTAERFKCLADDCVLYMWTTIPHEAIAHRVLELRGFKYVTQRAWFKQRPGAGRGPGYWVTGEHELLLIAVRGKVVPPATAHFPSAFSAPVGAHSEKPDQQYEHAEFHFPSLPKIELNARRTREGWDRWGYEAPLEVRSSNLPAAPRVGEPMEFSVGGLRKNVARFGIRRREDGCFEFNYNIGFTTSGMSGPWHGDFATFEDVMRSAMRLVRDFFVARRDAMDSVTSQAERRCARAGLEWIGQRCTEWGLALDAESQAKADAEIAATEGAQAPAAEGMDSTASRLAAGRAADTAEGDVVAALSSADEFFGEDERTIWKALSALDAGVTIEGPILDALLRDNLIMTGAVDCGYLLTTRGLSTLGMYDAYFNPAVDGLSTDELQELNEIPGEGASGTAREAPSAGSGDVDLQSASGTQSAPPHDSLDTDAPGCTAASAGGAGPLSTASPEPDHLEIPAFLKRQPDNSIPSRESEEAKHAAA